MAGAVAGSLDLAPVVHLGAVSKRSGVEKVYAVHFRVLLSENWLAEEAERVAGAYVNTVVGLSAEEKVSPFGVEVDHMASESSLTSGNVDYDTRVGTGAKRTWARSLR